MNAFKEIVRPLFAAIVQQEDVDAIGRIEQAFSRKGLDLRKRLLCAISALIVSDQPRHLRFFLEWAFHEYITPEEIYEVILQSYLFAGYPAALEGFFVLRDVLQDKRMSLGTGEVDYRVQEWRERGLKLCRQIYGNNFDQLQRNIEKISPELADWMIVEGYGKVLSRPRLGAVERELCTVAALTVLGRKRQLLSHMKGAFNVGARPLEMKEAILQTSLFAGQLSTLQALGLLQECDSSKSP